MKTTECFEQNNEKASVRNSLQSKRLKRPEEGGELHIRINIQPTVKNMTIKPIGNPLENKKIFLTDISYVSTYIFRSDR